MTEDDAYLAGLKRSDHGAVERLVGEFEGPLFRYFLAIHGDAGLAGEQSSDAFVELVRVIPRMRGGVDRLRGFVYAVARNVERRRWRQRPSGDAPLETALDQPANDLGPADRAEQNEELLRAVSALRTLDDTTREVFVLRYVEQLSVNEVATTLAMPVGTVKSRLHRGKEQLKRILTTQEGRS